MLHLCNPIHMRICAMLDAARDGLCSIYEYTFQNLAEPGGRQYVFCLLFLTCDDGLKVHTSAFGDRRALGSLCANAREVPVILFGLHNPSATCAAQRTKRIWVLRCAAQKCVNLVHKRMRVVRIACWSFGA